MTIALELEVEEEEQDISAEVVKAFIKEQEDNAQDTAANSEKEDAAVPENMSQDGNKVSYNFQADNTFAAPVKVEEIKDMIVGVNAQDIVVTPEDQKLYLKAILNDVPVRLNIPVLGGAVTVTCKALSVIESEKVITVTLKYFEEHPELNSALMGDYIRQLRTILQVDKINNRQAFSSVNLDENLFTSKAWTEIRTMSMTKFNAISAALNVFEHKLARMNSAALNEDFWHPGETD